MKFNPPPNCNLCRQRYPKINGMHYDELGFLPCEDEMMLNREEAQRTQKETHQDAQRAEIMNALIDHGPCTVNKIKQETGHSEELIRRVLRKAKEDGDVWFNWLIKRWQA